MFGLRGLTDGDGSLNVAKNQLHAPIFKSEGGGRGARARAHEHYIYVDLPSKKYLLHSRFNTITLQA
jgi:hypothetical protein